MKTPRGTKPLCSYCGRLITTAKDINNRICPSCYERDEVAKKAASDIMSNGDPEWINKFLKKIEEGLQ